jgi:hypothetical protein
VWKVTGWDTATASNGLTWTAIDPPAGTWNRPGPLDYTVVDGTGRLAVMDLMDQDAAGSGADGCSIYTSTTAAGTTLTDITTDAFRELVHSVADICQTTEGKIYISCKGPGVVESFDNDDPPPPPTGDVFSLGSTATTTNSTTYTHAVTATGATGIVLGVWPQSYTQHGQIQTASGRTIPYFRGRQLDGQFDSELVPSDAQAAAADGYSIGMNIQPKTGSGSNRTGIPYTEIRDDILAESGIYYDWILECIAEVKALPTYGVIPNYMQFHSEASYQPGGAQPVVGTGDEYREVFPLVRNLFRIHDCESLIYWQVVLNRGTYNGNAGGADNWYPAVTDYDFVGVDNYYKSTTWHSPAASFDAALAYARARGKKLWIDETGADEGGPSNTAGAKAAWYTALKDYLLLNAQDIEGVVFSHAEDGGNWFLDSILAGGRESPTFTGTTWTAWESLANAIDISAPNYDEDDRVVVFTWSGDGDGSNIPIVTDTIGTTGGWTQHESIQTVDGGKHLAVHSALIGASPSSGNIIATYADAQTGGGIHAVVVKGGGSVTQSQSNTATSGTASLTFNTFANPQAIAVVAALRRQIVPALTPPSGYSTTYDNGFDSPPTGITAAYLVGATDTSVQLTGSSDEFLMVGVEIGSDPGATGNADLSWAELEVPDVTAQTQVSWAELEVPEVTSHTEVSWAELEVPAVVVPPGYVDLSWAEMSVPDPAGGHVQVSWAEMELPIATGNVDVSWAEMEVPTPGNVDVSWAEMEVPDVSPGHSGNSSSKHYWKQLRRLIREGVYLRDPRPRG